jgi:hypothetical protein
VIFCSSTFLRPLVFAINLRGLNLDFSSFIGWQFKTWQNTHEKTKHWTNVEYWTIILEVKKTILKNSWIAKKFVVCSYRDDFKKLYMNFNYQSFEPFEILRNKLTDQVQTSMLTGTAIVQVIKKSLRMSEIYSCRPMHRKGSRWVWVHCHLLHMFVTSVKLRCVCFAFSSNFLLNGHALCLSTDKDFNRKNVSPNSFLVFLITRSRENKLQMWR